MVCTTLPVLNTHLEEVRRAIGKGRSRQHLTGEGEADNLSTPAIRAFEQVKIACPGLHLLFDLHGVHNLRDGPSVRLFAVVVESGERPVGFIDAVVADQKPRRFRREEQENEERYWPCPLDCIADSAHAGLIKSARSSHAYIHPLDLPVRPAAGEVEAAVKDACGDELPNSPAVTLKSARLIGVVALKTTAP